MPCDNEKGNHVTIGEMFSGKNRMCWWVERKRG